MGSVLGDSLRQIPVGAPVAVRDEPCWETGLRVAQLVASIMPFFFPILSFPSLAFRGATYGLTAGLSGLDLNRYLTQRRESGSLSRILLFSILGRIASVAWGVLGITALVCSLPILAKVGVGILLIGLTLDVIIYMERRRVFQPAIS